MAGCSTIKQPQDAAVYGRARWAVLVKQDANLYKVDSRLYRSEQLVHDDIAQIERLGIQSIVNLRFFDRNDDRQLLGGRGFNLINSPLLTWQIKPKDIAKTLYLIEASQQSGPVLVHCYHGADCTGLIVGMYRIIYQGWPVEAAKQEMQQGPYGYHSIWKNIDKLFTQEKVDEVKVHLNTLRMQQVFRPVEMPV
ncbi:protein tyrosine phosphatase [Neisseria sp. 83E34]|nr:protein tyrosine phosphatase [Neisseria sp. 83E34]